MNVEDAELAALVGQAFDLRDTPYLVDAVRAITDWHDRRMMRRWARLELMLETIRATRTNGQSEVDFS